MLEGVYMTCKNCHKSITVNDRYCQHCGENNADFIDTKKEKSKSNDEMHASTYHLAQNEVSMPQSSSDEDEQFNLELQRIEAKNRAYLKELYKQRDYASVSAIIVAFLFPIIGVLMSLSWRKEYPHKSAQVFNASIIGFIVNAIILAIFM